jgi:hypothetical protein
MARIVYGALVTSVRGSVGGTTFQKNKFGFTIKNKPKMILPLSRDQFLSKNIIRRCTTLWATLTPGERLSWINFAATYPQFSKHNPAVAISGYNLFVMWSFQYLLSTFVENSPILECQTILPELPVVTLSVHKPSSSSLILYSVFTPSSEDWHCNISATGPVRNSVNFFQSKYRFLVGIDSFITEMDITDLYAAKFGRLPAVGEYIGLSYVLYASFGGRVAAALSGKYLVTA